MVDRMELTYAPYTCHTYIPDMRMRVPVFVCSLFVFCFCWDVGCCGSGSGMLELSENTALLSSVHSSYMYACIMYV